MHFTIRLKIDPWFYKKENECALRYATMHEYAEALANEMSIHGHNLAILLGFLETVELYPNRMGEIERFFVMEKHPWKVGNTLGEEGCKLQEYAAACKGNKSANTRTGQFSLIFNNYEFWDMFSGGKPGLFGTDFKFEVRWWASCNNGKLTVRRTMNLYSWERFIR